MQNRLTMFAGLAPILLAIAGCSGAEATTDAPALSDDTLTPAQAVSWSSATMTTATPTLQANVSYNIWDDQVRASVSWTGSGTYATGACLLNRVEVGYIDEPNRVEWTEPVTCTAASECASYNTYTDGSAYCAAPNNSGQKYCYVRPGSQSQFCVGTPADGVQVTVPATKTSAYKNAFSYYRGYYNYFDDPWNDGGSWFYNDEVRWVMYGCWAACTGGPNNNVIKTPSVSAEKVISYSHL